jgi:hypothetical protein
MMETSDERLAAICRYRIADQPAADIRGRLHRVVAGHEARMSTARRYSILGKLHGCEQEVEIAQVDSNPLTIAEGAQKLTITGAGA